MNDIKSGKEIMDDFFSQLDKIPGVDQEIAKLLVELYKTDSLTENNIINSLAELRRVETKNDKD